MSAGGEKLWLVFAGLMLALVLAALDQNIVATALPRIVSDLGGLAHLSWAVTAFMVASICRGWFQPLAALQDGCMRRNT
jgi:MFS family permease